MKGVGRDLAMEDYSHGTDDDGCFTNRMSDIRQRLLDVFGMNRKNAEVGDRQQHVDVLLECRGM